MDQEDFRPLITSSQRKQFYTSRSLLGKHTMEDHIGSPSSSSARPINVPSSSRRSDDGLSTPSQPRATHGGSRSILSPAQTLLPSAPASPPTPAPSPTPQKHRLPSWSTANDGEDAFLREARPHFSRLDGQERQRFLAEILNLCNSQQLSFVLNYVSPRLKKDPFRCLPNELCLRVNMPSTW